MTSAGNENIERGCGNCNSSRSGGRFEVEGKAKAGGTGGGGSSSGAGRLTGTGEFSEDSRSSGISDIFTTGFADERGCGNCTSSWGGG
jgi:hypothetical protein